MADKNPERDSYFPAIEKKHGLPMAYWFDQMKEIAALKYPEQIVYLRENHGFSQTHANALVLYSRGNTSSRRYDTIDQYLVQFDDTKQETVKKIFAVLTKAYPKSEVVIAWNQPMLKLEGQYVFGVSVLKNHILIAPWGDGIIEQFKTRLTDYEVNKKTIKIPVDWKVDAKLLKDLSAARIAEFKH